MFEVCTECSKSLLRNSAHERSSRNEDPFLGAADRCRGHHVEVKVVVRVVLQDSVTKNLQ